MATAPIRASETVRLCRTPSSAALPARNELGDLDVPERAVRRRRLPGTPDARLGVGGHARAVTLRPRLGADLGPVAVAGCHHRDPHLVDYLLVDHGAEDDVG